MNIVRHIRLLVHDHTLFHHGAVLPVTDHDVMETANPGVVHRKHAEEMVAKGQAEWVEAHADRAHRQLQEHADMLARHASEHREMRERHDQEHRQAIGMAGLATLETVRGI